MASAPDNTGTQKEGYQGVSHTLYVLYPPHILSMWGLQDADGLSQSAQHSSEGVLGYSN